MIEPKMKETATVKSFLTKHQSHTVERTLIQNLMDRELDIQMQKIHT